MDMEDLLLSVLSIPPWILPYVHGEDLRPDWYAGTLARAYPPQDDTPELFLYDSTAQPDVMLLCKHSYLAKATSICEASTFRMIGSEDSSPKENGLA